MIFRCLFPDTIIDHIVEYSNNPDLDTTMMHPQWNIHSTEWSQQSGISSDEKYCDVDPTEPEIDVADEEDDETDKSISMTRAHVYLLIATVIAMTLNNQHSIQNYWMLETTKSGIFGSRFIQDLWQTAGIGRDQALILYRKMRANQQFLEFQTNKIFAQWWEPSQKVVVDETLYLFEGRYKHKQHIPNKPHATGLKMFMTVDERHFIYRWWQYRGHQPPVTTIVMDFIQALPRANYIVCTDTYYSSLELADQLHSKGNQFVLNCRSDRPSGLWAMMKESAGAMINKQWFTKTDGTMTTTIKKDSKKSICFLTDYAPMVSFKRKSAREQIAPVNTEYNYLSRFMDVADAMMEHFRFRHRQSRWTHTALWFAIQVILHNAYIMNSQDPDNGTSSHEDFLVTLATALRDLGLSLLSITCTSQDGTASTSSTAQHCSTRMAEIELFGSASGSCILCHKRGQRYRCHEYICRECMQVHWSLSNQ